VDYTYIRNEGKAGRMGQRLMAIVAEGNRGKVYISPDDLQIEAAARATPTWKPELALPENPRDFKTPNYGLLTFGDLFTPRQLVAMNTFSDLIAVVTKKCLADAIAARTGDDPTSLDEGGSGALAYSQAVSVYMAFAVDRLADYGSSIATWKPSGEQVMQTYKRQAIPMTWDFPESNILGDRAICWLLAIKYEVENLLSVGYSSVVPPGRAVQASAQSQTLSTDKIVSTDPPYFDNIGYADLSDFFYVWLRRSLKTIFPGLYATLAVPKAEELVASPYRHGNKGKAEAFFLSGMEEAIIGLSEQAHPAFPVTIYYAFKQSETDTDDATASSGWVTFLEAVLRSGCALSGTWPMRTELSNRMIGSGNNALASSIVLVCRKRSVDALTISRREFLRELHSVLPDALIDMTRGGENSPVAPVDLSQAIIGPGMGIFSKYKAVLEADGSPMSVRTALQLINRFLADDEFDPATQFCLQWFEANYWKPGVYGSADVAARAKGTDVSLLNRDGVLESGAGEVRLLRWSDLEDGWAPEQGNQTPVWQALQELIRSLNTHGEQAAGALLARMPAVSGPVRTLAYRLYTLCERKGLAEDARAYNELIGAWAAIELAAIEIGPIETQAELF